jgi:uncharacterized membrane protein (UPF0127 family)
MKKKFCAADLPDGGPVAGKVEIADTFWSRFCGLMGRAALPRGEGLLLRGCSGIHCMFMRFTIDAVYLDRDMTVIGTQSVRPWKLGSIFRGTKHVLELPEGAQRPPLRRPTSFYGMG